MTARLNHKKWGTKKDVVTLIRAEGQGRSGEMKEVALKDEN